MASPADPNRATNDLLRRVPPHSVEAEQAVLGGIFIRNSVFHTLVDTLSSDDFYLPAHQTLYTCFLELYRKNAPIDLVSVASYLKDHGQLEAVGGAAYLSELAQTVVSGANAEYYSTIVRDKSLQRSLIGACSDIISNCFDQSRSVDALLDESEQAVFSISERTSGKVFKSSKELVNRVFEELTKRFEQKEAVTGVTTGYNRLDQMTAGLQPSDLIIVAARPSMGKTAFALNMAMRAAVQDNVPVAIYSLEMSMDQLMMRMLCAWGKVDLGHLRRGYLDSEEWSRLYHAADVLGQAPIYIDDTPALSPLELRARTRRLKAESGVGLVMVDYLQLMRGSKRTDSREQEISEISRSLKGLRRKWIFRSWRFRSSTVNWKSARTNVRCCPTSASRAPSNRTPTSSCSSTATKYTTSSPTTRTRARRKSSSASSATAPSARRRSPILAPTPHLRISNPDCRPSLPKRAANNLPEVRHETTRSHSANVHARSGSRRGTVVRAFLA